MSPAPVSVVVPMRDEARTVAGLLEGLARQTLKPAQLLFVDTGSRDGSAARVLDWWQSHGWPDTECRVVESPGAYPGGGRNAGVDAASQPWIAFLDCGTAPEPGWLQALVQCAADSGSGGALGVCRFEAEDAWQRALCALSYGVGAERPALPASLFARTIFDRAGRFDPALRAGEDTLWLQAVAAQGELPATCGAARVIYSHFPATPLAALRKWFGYERSVSAARIGGWSRRLVMMAPLLLFILPFFAPVAGSSLWILYLALRGVADPIRRSGRRPWWGDEPAAVLCAPLAALCVDTGRALGSLAGLLGHAQST
jgi:GT2 family glycosyltransferase